MNKESIMYILTFFVVLLAVTVAVSYTGKTESLENFHKVEVKEGDSIWSIADKFHKDTKISKQDFVEWVHDKNNLHTGVIKPGDLVVVPIDKEEIYHFEQIASD